MNKKKLATNNKIFRELKTDRTFRRTLTFKSHLWFFKVFLSHYITYPIAEFQKKMFDLTQNQELKLICIMAFRGSGKSTIMNLSYTLWSIFGTPQKKFVLIVSKRSHQSRSHFENIKTELGSNELLKNDLGPFKATSDEQGSNFIEIKNSGAKIMMISARQSIRGLRHGIYRPDLIILDDIEDNLSMNNKHESEQTYEWFMNEVIPSGDSRTTIIVLGNCLKAESVLTRLGKEIENKNIPGVFCVYPIADNEGVILWPGKFLNSEAIKKIYEKNHDIESWLQEYALISQLELIYEIQELNKLIFENAKSGTKVVVRHNSNNILNHLGFDYNYLKPTDEINCSKSLFQIYIETFELATRS